MANVAVIGAGSWGIALSKVLHSNGNQVTVWSIVEDEIAMLREKHEHLQKLPGVKLPGGYDIYNGSQSRSGERGIPDFSSSFCFHQKHRKEHGTFREEWPGDRVCGEGD